MGGVTIEKPKTPEDLIPIHIKKSDVPPGEAAAFKNPAHETVRALVDNDQHVQVDVLSMPSVPVEPSFKDAAEVSRRALVDAEQHAQVDVLTSGLPSGAATEGTLATLLKDTKIPDALAQRAATYDLYVQLRSAGVEIDPRDVTDRAARLLGKVDVTSTVNPPNFDVLLSTRASEDTLKLIPSRWIPPGATEKSWSANASPAAAGDQEIVDYVPASGKIVRITDVTASGSIDGHARVMWDATQLWKQFLTAKIPGGQSFTRALSVTGDGTKHLKLIVYASAAGDVTGTMLGYEE